MSWLIKSRELSYMSSAKMARTLRISAPSCAKYERNPELMRLGLLKTWYDNCCPEGQAVIRDNLSALFFDEET